jgi:hypothetical protein
MSSFGGHARVTVAAVLAGIGYAEGGPPMLTDDPGTPGNGRWEVNLAGTIEAEGDDRRWELPHLDVNYGLGDRLQLKAESGWVVDDQQGSASGLGGSQVGVKWRFLDEADGRPACSTYPQVEFGSPSRWAVRAETSRPLAILPVQIERAVGSFTVGADGGALLQRREQPHWFWGAIVGHHVGRGEAMAEIHTVTGVEAIANVGGRYPLTDSLSVLASVGRRLGDSGPRLDAFLGVRIAL